MTGGRLRRLQELAAGYLKGLGGTRATKEANLAGRPSERKWTRANRSPVFVALSPTKSVSARSLVQTGARDFPTLAIRLCGITNQAVASRSQ
jgi:hypothetical protein